MDIETSWGNISQAELFNSDDEDVFSRIELGTSDPIPQLMYLDCTKDCSHYDDWVTDKCFTNVFPVDEVALHDPGLMSDMFRMARQTILEMKLLGQNQQSMRLSVTNLLHYVHNELGDAQGQKDIEMIRSLLNLAKFAPTAQDSKQYIHGFFEWKLLLALISSKSGESSESVKGLCAELVSYSLAVTGSSDIRQTSPFPCKCFEGLWSVLVTMTKIENEPIWSLLEFSIQSMDSLPTRTASRKYRDSSLTYLWFLRYLPTSITDKSYEFHEVVARGFATFLEKKPPEADLRIALFLFKNSFKGQLVPADSVILIWEQLYKRINSNFKTINLDSTNSLLVPNDTAVSYINKIRSMIVHQDDENGNQTSYDLFLEILIRAWQRASEENDLKYQQKLSNRILLKFTSKMWLPLNEIGIHNLLNLLLVIYYLGDDRTSDRIENVLLSVPFPEITHNRRVAVFKGLTAVLVMFYGKEERKNKSYADNFVKKFENAVGVDRFTGRQLVSAMDTIFTSSSSFNQKEYAILNPWMKSYLSVCMDNDKEVLFETLTRVLEKFCRLRANNLATEESEEVVKRIYQSLETLIISYLNAEQETDISSFCAQLLLSLKQPISGVPLVDSLFTNLILNNAKNPRLQFKIVNKLVALSDQEASVVHINTWIKSFLKMMLLVDGSAELQPLLGLIKDSREFSSFCCMDCDEFSASSQPFTVFLKGIRTSYESLESESETERFYNRFEMYFQMYTKWYLPYLQTAEDALKVYSNTTALIFICGNIIYRKRTPNMLKSLISDFCLTSALLGRKAQPPVITRAMAKVMHTLLGGLFKLESSTGDEYFGSVIHDLIHHWTPQFNSELNLSGTVVPFLKFTRANHNTSFAVVLYERLCKALLTPNSQRDILAINILKEILNQCKGELQLGTVILRGSLPGILEYYCKSEDLAPVKRPIIELLEKISTMNFLGENIEMSRVLDEVFESWTMNLLFVQSSNYFELAIKLARLFPVNLRMIMPKVREEIRNRDGQLGSFMAVDRLHQKLRNLEMILKQQK